jgi:hypothetical protein
MALNMADWFDILDRVLVFIESTLVDTLRMSQATTVCLVRDKESLKNDVGRSNKNWAWYSSWAGVNNYYC